MDRHIQINGVYRHFEDDAYKMIGTSIYSETRETLVIYHRLNNPETLYARLITIFLS